LKKLKKLPAVVEVSSCLAAQALPAVVVEVSFCLAAQVVLMVVNGMFAAVMISNH
jgi:hypothetical protein